MKAVRTIALGGYGTYIQRMLRSLRGPSGRPGVATRVLAGLVVLGALIATAPVLLIPFAEMVLGAVGAH